VTLETLEPLARICVDRMLVDRERSSSAFYPELPCVIAKSLLDRALSPRRVEFRPLRRGCAR